MNLQIGIRGDLPSEIYMTSEFFISFHENLMISQKPYAQEEKFVVSFSKML